MFDLVSAIELVRVLGVRPRLQEGVQQRVAHAALALDSPQRGTGLARVHSPSGILGEESFDDRAERSGAQERRRCLVGHSGERGEQRVPVEGRPALNAGEQSRAE